VSQCEVVFVVWDQHWRVFEYAGVLIGRENVGREVKKVGEKTRSHETVLGRMLEDLRASTPLVRH